MTEVHTSPNDPTTNPSFLASGAAGDLPDCCKETITKHVSCNPMMVCPTCKSLIKCFTDQKAFKNYISFCNSRRREVLQADYQGYGVVTFKSYD